MSDLVLIGPGPLPDPAPHVEALRALSPARILVSPDGRALRAEGADEAGARALADAVRARRAADALIVPEGLSAAACPLIALDMDGTLIENECIDDMAALCGRAAQMRRLTREAMEGRATFVESLTRRTALLAGAPADVAARAGDGIRPNPGAEALVAFMRRHGAEVWIISGGFTQITERAAARFGATGVVCNELVVRDGRLTGGVTGPGGGPILDAAGKRRAFEALLARMGASAEAAVAAGDGANDVEMLRAAGLGFAYRAKPVAAAATELRIDLAGLDAVAACFGEWWADPRTL